MFEAVTFLDAALIPGFFIALIAGVLSFLSPCVLPIVPPYLAYMSGTTVADLETGGRGRPLITAAFFVLGLSTVFLILGFAFSSLGRAYLSAQDWFLTGAALLIMVFGLHFMGILRIPFMLREARFDAGDRGGSRLGAYLLGLAFAFGWTPCLGPILGAILGLAASEGDVGRGTLMLAAYAIGLGLPFLLVAAFFPRLKGVLNWMKRHLDVIERISGLLLWTVGLMMLTGQFTVFAFWLQETFPGLAALG